jgi:tetracycline 7-halogenase / FADH2 O2-dependent halogenase
VQQQYDVVIVGSGIAGSILALTLSRVGCRVLVVEKGKHPRFTIGESTVPTMTLGMRQLAERYGVPELADVCHYLGLKKRGLTGYPKRHFWFGLHHPHQEIVPGEEIVLDTFPLPVGPDIHMLRADVDGFLVSRFADYGVDYLDMTEVVDFEHAAGANRLLLRTPHGDEAIVAKLAVDASGHASFFAERFGLRERPCRFHTKTRAIFGHFRDVGPLDNALGSRPHPFRYQRDSGTMQHCFDGGWIWVIPFDDGVTSVGFMLDPERFPLDPNVSPEAEIESIMDRFPSVRAHLGQMTPIRPLVRSGRVQFSCRNIVGDGFVLTPHAAAFIDPLFSTGMLLTVTFINRLVPLIEQAMKDDDFSADRFRPLEEAFFKEIDLVDLAVSGMIASFRDFEMFRQYWRIWVQASAYQYFASAGMPSGTPVVPYVYGAGLKSWRETVAAMHEVVTNRELPAQEAAARLKELKDAVPQPFSLRRYAMNTGQPLYIHTQMDPLKVLRWFIGFYREPELRPHLRLRGLTPRLMTVMGVGTGQIKLAAQYLRSKWRGTALHTWIDGILAMNAGSGKRLLESACGPQAETPASVPCVNAAHAMVPAPHVEPFARPKQEATQQEPAQEARSAS